MGLFIWELPGVISRFVFAQHSLCIHLGHGIVRLGATRCDTPFALAQQYSLCIHLGHGIVPLGTTRCDIPFFFRNNSRCVYT